MVDKRYPYEMQNPFLRTFVPSVGLVYTIQAAFAVPSITAQSERFYDLSGSLTYISCAALSLFIPAVRATWGAAGASGGALPPLTNLLSVFSSDSGRFGFDWRQVALSTAVALWATRLASYLFPRRQRIMAYDADSQFKSIRESPSRFLGTFMAQATWTTLRLMPVLAINSLPASTFASLDSAVLITDIVGVLLYVAGFSFEVIADRQKTTWVQEKKEEKHEEELLTSGLWSKSRHPNFFGESLLWTGIATTAAGVLASGPGTADMALAGGLTVKAISLLMASISPAFVTYWLFKSVIPLSENRYDKRYGDREDYKRWKRETPVFFPKF
ncbi:hypothetical protein LTR70_008341 [Exophiala xenobiotica]|nr:hypothetical protein LTR70_008341 [Exophiala xenobiotica]